eukprot:1424471-Rhodomonas_salina.1
MVCVWMHSDTRTRASRSESLYADTHTHVCVSVWARGWRFMGVPQHARKVRQVERGSVSGCGSGSELSEWVRVRLRAGPKASG